MTVRNGNDARFIDNGAMQKVDIVPDDLKKQIENAAGSGGRQSHFIQRLASRYWDGIVSGKLGYATKILESASAAKVAAEDRRDAFSRELDELAPQVTEETKKLGVADWFALGVMIMVLLGVLYFENTIMATMLISSGVAGLESMAQARAAMLTPAGPGIAMIFAYHLLPRSKKRLLVSAAAALLVFSALSWTIGFATEVQRYVAATSLTFVEAGTEAGTAWGGWSAWLMFAALCGGMMPTTVFLGELGISTLIHRNDILVENEQYELMLSRIADSDNEIEQASLEIAEAKEEIENLKAVKKKGIAVALAHYKSQYKKVSKFTNVGLCLTFVLGAVGCSQPTTPSDHGVTVITAAEPTPVVALVISDSLTSDVEELTRTEVMGYCEMAAKSSTANYGLVVINGWTGSQIAAFRLQQNPAKRIRELKQSFAQFSRWLDKDRRERANDGRIHFPRVVQAIAQVPGIEHCVVIGNPLFVDEGSDRFFSMDGGRVPSDGLLFQDRQQSVYSVIGRKKSLQNLFFHFGWPDNHVFENDSHSQQVTSFWHKYLQEQSGTLVTALNDPRTAFRAALRGLKEPLMFAQADRSSEPSMTRIVQEDFNEVVEGSGLISIEEVQKNTNIDERTRRLGKDVVRQHHEVSEGSQNPSEDLDKSSVKHLDEGRRVQEHDDHRTSATEHEADVSELAKDDMEVVQQATAEGTPAQWPVVQMSNLNADVFRPVGQPGKTSSYDWQLERLLANGKDAVQLIVGSLPNVSLKPNLPPPPASKIDDQQATFDRHGNIGGAENDLITNGQMDGQTIVIAKFHSDADVDDSPLYDVLATKGYKIRKLGYPLPSLPDFEAILTASHQLWIWSSPHVDRLPPKHQDAIVSRWYRGELALCLMSDNEPYHAEAELLLRMIAPNSTIGGDYPGEQTIGAHSEGGPGFLKHSKLFFNITRLWEGKTVSAVSGPELQIVCRSSHDTGLIATYQTDGSSRLAVHCGFTSFYRRFWNDAGVERLAANLAGWLSGVEEDPDLVRAVDDRISHQ